MYVWQRQLAHFMQARAQRIDALDWPGAPPSSEYETADVQVVTGAAGGAR